MRLILESDGDIVALVRSAAADSIVVVAQHSADALWTAFARAAIGPLAIERAPGCRVNAVFAGEGALPADINAAADFLDQARSTTGQIIDVRAHALP